MPRERERGEECAPLICLSWQSICTNVVFPHPAGAVNRSWCTSSFNSSVFNSFIGVSNPTVKSGGLRTAQNTLFLSKFESSFSRVIFKFKDISVPWFLVLLASVSSSQDLAMSSSHSQSSMGQQTLKQLLHHRLFEHLQTCFSPFFTSSVERFVFFFGRSNRFVSSLNKRNKRFSLDPRRLRRALFSPFLNVSGNAAMTSANISSNPIFIATAITLKNFASIDKQTQIFKRL